MAGEGGVMQIIETIRCADVRFVKELYPRIKPLDDVVERYRDAIDNLPPITIARDCVLVDGYHRWQAHVREQREEIAVENLGNLTDAEIIRESIRRNAEHGQQLSRQDKQRMAAHLWAALAHLPNGERVDDIAELLAVSRDAVERWTKKTRQLERQAMQARAWDMWLDCISIRDIAATLDGPNEDTIGKWLSAKSADAVFSDAPASRQHFDIWQFQTADKDDGQQSYFGAVPPQVIENLLWFYTEPGDIVVDLFSGAGTAVDVAKNMGRRVWASDIRGNHYSPHLPIHKHDAITGWPETAPRSLIDAKHSPDGRPNYAIETTAIEVAEIYVNQLFTPTFFVFSDWQVLTPRDARQRGYRGPEDSAGSGTPYVLVGKGWATPFDDWFPPTRRQL